MQRTLAIIKPDAVERQLVGAIIQRVEGAELRIRAMRLAHLTRRRRKGSTPCTGASRSSTA